MDLKSYLLELIATQKIIGINAFGTLYKNKIPGRYDFETHSFLPPKYEISFTTGLKEDETLANFISEKKNISVESANYYINAFVENIQTQLTDHQQADFSPFGELKLIDDQIVFEPSKTFEISFDFYGLPRVAATVEENLILEDTETTEDIESEEKAEDIESEEKIVDTEFKEKAEDIESEEKAEDIESEEKTVDTEFKEKAEDAESEEKAEDAESEEKAEFIVHETKGEDTKSRPEQDEQPVYDEIADVNDIQTINEIEERLDVEKKEDTDTVPFGITDPLWKPTVIHPYNYDDDDDDGNTGRGKRIFFKTLLVLFIIAIAGAVVYFFYPDVFSSMKEHLDSNQIENKTMVMIDSNLNSKIDSPITDSVKNTPILTNVVKDSLIYEVIGSAMKTQRKADEVILTLSKRGISAKKMEAMPGKLIKISLGTFTNFKLAKKLQDSLKIKLRNPEIYIQTIKPKN
ncbi:MAG: hypothetical protein H7202_01840 [Pedobacter sp.]|nr:hypothetical protein [Pedobacter sp.]